MSTKINITAELNQSDKNIRLKLNMEPKFLMLDDIWSSYPLVLFDLDEISDLIPYEWVSDYKSNWNENCDAGEEIDFDTAKKQITEDYTDSLTTVDGFCEKNKILWVNNEFYKYFDSGDVKFLGLFSNLNECKKTIVELVYGSNFVGDCPVYKMDNGEFMVDAGTETKIFKTKYEAVKYSQMLTTAWN